MATIGEIYLPDDEFALCHTLETIESVHFEIERMVAHDSDHLMPYVWVSDVDRTELEDVLEDDPTIDEFELLAEPDQDYLYRMNWIDSIETLVHILTEEEGTILVAESTDRGWFLRVLFPSREALSATYDFCQDHDLSIDVQRIYNIDDGRQGRFGLSADQEDTIAEAYERGYYSVPRRTSLTDLAEDLDISHQALSERLRRGHQRLVENTVIVGRKDGKEE
ncbi:helix-turn-helix domain-containing protein [Halalkalicoccus ordinarius]|uniref:helix-turn-helix domain-containing protein n=1 Tax=Halalkalicoccus ordinarius TaxID=3116651 RepID=UPI00300F4613